jgi:hypothetical protein
MPEHSQERTIGPVSAVPCSWCKKTLNLADIHEQIPLEKGHVIDCLKEEGGCGRQVIVAAVDHRPRVVLAQYRQ